jgi:NADH dehydrogenase
MPKVLVVGGGYAGFYAAWHLEKKLKPGEAEIVVVDPRPYMTYQPFLPEVTAGAVEARPCFRSSTQHLRSHNNCGLTRTRAAAPSANRAGRRPNRSG